MRTAGIIAEYNPFHNGHAWQIAELKKRGFEAVVCVCSPGPGYYGNSTINSRTINYHIGVNIEKLFDLLCEQILAGLCFSTSIEGKCNV